MTKAASLDPDNTVFRGWANSTDKDASPSKLVSYFFNITNPDEVLTGTKPNVEQFGPYVYIISKQREDISFTTDTFGEKIVEYTESKRYIFQPDESDGTESDFFTTTNPVFHYWRAIDPTHQATPALYSDPGMTDKDRIFITKTVKEILFGWMDSKYNQNSGFFPGLVGPPVKSANAIYTGETRIETAFQYVKRAGLNGYIPSPLNPKSPMWATFDASRLVGTDGTRFTPFLNKTKPIHMFVEEAKRTIPMVYTGEFDLYGLDMYEYRIPNATLESGYVNPENFNWQMHFQGAFNLSQSVMMPMMLTKPHFLDGGVELTSSVTGLTPNRELHDTVLGIHKVTGAVMRASKMLQVTMNTLGPYTFQGTDADTGVVTPVTWFPDMLPQTFQPMAIVSEKGQIKEKDAKKLNKKISRASSLHHFASWGLLIIIVVFFGIAAVFLFLAHKASVSSAFKGDE